MPIRPLESPSSKHYRKPGPITNTFYSQYNLTEEEIKLYEALACLPKPDLSDAEPDEQSEVEKEFSSPPSSDPDQKPDFHPVDCPAQFPSEPE